MKTLIDSYSSFPGDHCGSVAMRGLLHHYCGLDLPEAAVFGLGAGPASVYLTGPHLDPGAILFGRTMTMEVDLGKHLGIDYRERSEPDDQKAWEVVRDEVLAGRPTMLSGDIFYLDYREFKVHFPAHRFVLVGFDEEAGKVFIGDRIRPEPEVCSMGALATSRNPPEGMSTFNQWGRFHDTKVGTELNVAARTAIARCAQSMFVSTTPPESGESGMLGGARAVNGIAAVRTFADDVRGWHERADASWVASFNASCIEKFGNGGGNFRRLYAGFLSWARELDSKLVPESAPGLAVDAADAWTGVSNALFAGSQEDSNASHFEAAGDQALRAAEIEDRLFRMLADTSA
jgi:hypothetical protein